MCVTQTVALPVESYALKSIARWLALSGVTQARAQCNDQWLETSDRTFLDTIQRYNEDDCRATRHVKDWLITSSNSRGGILSLNGAHLSGRLVGDSQERIHTFYLLIYDLPDNKAANQRCKGKLHKMLSGYGKLTQYSVFECFF